VACFLIHFCNWDRVHCTRRGERDHAIGGQREGHEVLAPERGNRLSNAFCIVYTPLKKVSFLVDGSTGSAPQLQI
jgi:hypothetical protein